MKELKNMVEMHTLNTSCKVFAAPQPISFESKQIYFKLATMREQNERAK